VKLTINLTTANAEQAAQYLENLAKEIRWYDKNEAKGPDGFMRSNGGGILADVEWKKTI